MIVNDNLRRKKLFRILKPNEEFDYFLLRELMMQQRQIHLQPFQLPNQLKENIKNLAEN